MKINLNDVLINYYDRNKLCDTVEDVIKSIGDLYDEKK